jgi:hypothetical protein
VMGSRLPRGRVGTRPHACCPSPCDDRLNEEEPVPRAHCLDCGDHVVIDPTGRCPSGHEVGIPGARIEGSLGSSTPHPGEPEPWVARVELDVELSPPPAATPTREIRPPAAPPAPLATTLPTSPPAPVPTARPDDVLRELHSLGDLGAAPPRADVPAPAASRASAPPPPSAPAPPAPPASPPVWSAPAQHDDALARQADTAAASRSAFEELSALEAAVHALTGANGTPRPSTNGFHRSNGHDVNGHEFDGSSNGHGGGDLGSSGALQHAQHAPGLEEDHRSAEPAARSEALDAPHAPPFRDEVAPSISDQLDDLFAAAEARTGPSPSVPPAPVAPPVRPAELDAPERWSVLADVAELAESAPMPPAASVPPVTTPPVAPPPAPPIPPAAGASAPSAPPAPAAPADPGIDLGNFTASGKRVGEGKGKRRLFGR